MRAHALSASLALASCALLVATTSTEAVPLVDQTQAVIDDSVGALALGGASEQVVAQVVTVGLTGTLVEVDLPVACDTGDPLVLQIQSVTGGQPDGGILRAQTYAGSGLPSFFPDPPELRPLLIDVPLPVTTGQQLAIVLSSPGVCAVFQGPVGDPYPSGDGWFDARPNPPGVWLPLGPPLGDRSDLPFATVVDDGAPVGVDFMTRSRSNRINPRRGSTVDAAVLSSASFDASTLDWTTVALGPAGAPALGPGLASDVDGDGLVDLVLDFNVSDLGLACGDTSIALLAATSSGLGVRGTDAVIVVGCGGRP